MGWQDRRLTRRLVTVPGTVAAAAISTLTAPFTMIVAVIADRGRPWQRCRLVALVAGALVVEVIGLIVAAGAWMAAGFGTRIDTPRAQQRHARLMGWYCSTLLAWITRVVGTDVEWRLPDTITGPAVILARHTSFFDALLPATILSKHPGLAGHHVLTAGLRYLPNLDIVGHRMPTAFITRTKGADGQLDEIAAIGAGLDQAAVAVIFPEGTFRSEARFQRILDRLRSSQPELAERAATLRHVLPPRPAGTHALLRAAPSGTKIYLCANTGLEAFSTLAEIRASLVATRPIVVELWEVDTASMPEEPQAFGAWLLETYREIDAWVSAELANTPGSPDRVTSEN